MGTGAAVADDESVRRYGFVARAREVAHRTRAQGAGWREPALLVAGEACCAVAVAGVLTAAGSRLTIDPESDAGRVSILASVQLVALALALLVVVFALVASRWAHRLRRFCWAAMSGVASGVVAGGVAAAVNGSPWSLNGLRGDGATILGWARDAMRGQPSAPEQYPPGAIDLVVWLARATGWGVAPSQRAIEVVGLALIGPLGYLAWRAVRPPSWAAVISVVSSAPFLDAYKPYTAISLVVATPLLISIVLLVRRAGALPRWQVVARGGGAGVLLGMLCLLYSGWFAWFVPGLVVAAVAGFPWRHGALRGLVALVAAGVGFVAVAGRYLVAVLTGPPIVDTYQYFDTKVDPAYFVAWRGDLPGKDATNWPPFGELGGVGVFTLLVIAGLGLALALAWEEWTVRTLALVFAGAWGLRFWLARGMWASGQVQLYPRTSQVLLHVALVGGVIAACTAMQRLARPSVDDVARSFAAGRVRGWVIGGLVTLFLVAASVGSATADTYMPANDGSLAQFTWYARHPSTGVDPQTFAELSCWFQDPKCG